MARTYEFDVQMSCGGCASAVTTAITALPNIQSVNASVEKQRISVIAAGDTTFDQVRLAIQNTGKKVKGSRILEGETVKEIAVEAPGTAN
ncbi:hypothetical protein Purlil1_13535 [Purpureocillium lilacinum]|uniref:HMA domain-containing protein n=1 Tax=Purpureocillium lilacinum TaxID=33203 RepID=A0ABR0BDV7_PURLI|nr:hypothetical protein Purlil1_13535 [Purpureocillium lilacinum]